MIFSKNKLLVIFIMFVVNTSFAQKTAVYDEPNNTYQKALALYQIEQYGPAQNNFQKTISYINDENSLIQIDAEYYSAICAVQLFNNDAELLLQNFIKKHPESIHIKYSYFQLGKFQYRKQNYKNAIESFANVDVYDLSREEQLEYYFKLGYSYFKEDEMPLAKVNLSQVINEKGKYQEVALYYYSHICYQDGNFETALQGFLALQNNETFKEVIPYYITHIYYLQMKYDELLKVAPSLLDKATPKRKPEITRLIGESYYHKEQFKLAIKYLEEYYKTTTETVNNNTIYQLAYSYYKLNDYENAIKYFQIVSDVNDNLAQSANYQLAICYVRVDKKSYALTSFQKAYKEGTDDAIKADALYNFAKLSYELDYNPYNQALNAFEQYVNEYPNSEHRDEAMSNLTKMYLSTNNYSRALESIEKIQNKSPELQIANQRILYSLGIQAFSEDKYDDAIAYFNKSLYIDKSNSYTSKSLFWKAESYYKLANYNAAIDIYNQFLLSAGAFSESNYNDAYYNLAYSYFNIKDYKNANLSYRLFILNAKDKKDQVCNDVQNRIGDTYFIQSDFASAIESYNQALAIGKRDADYSLYKKAEALGALGRNDEKALAFQQLINKYPNSIYEPNAEYALAQTYYKVLNQNALASRYYLNIISKYPEQNNLVRKSKLDLGYLYNNSNRPDDAIEMLKSVYTDYKGSVEAKEALNALQGIYSEQNNISEFFSWVKSQGIEMSVNTQDSANYYVAENLYMQNNCEQAIASFKTYMKLFPSGNFITNASFYKAECENKMKNYTDALIDYQFVVNKGGSVHLEEALKSISYINYDILKNYNDARKSFVKLSQIAESKENYKLSQIGIMHCDWFTNSYDSLISSSNNVLKLENLSQEVKKEALLYQSRVYVEKEDWANAIPILQQLRKNKGTIEGTEATYQLAYIYYQKQLYDSAEALTYSIIQQDPSYEKWVVKSFILSSDIFVETNNLYQAKATLNSIIDNYDGDEVLLNEAKTKLKKIEGLLAADKKEKSENEETVIELNKNKKLFEEPTTPNSK